MAGITSTTRFHLRAAGAWAAMTGVLLAFRVGGDVTLVEGFLAAGNAALLSAPLGVMGNAWLASHLLTFSTMLSKKGLPAGISRAIGILWQIAVAGIVASQFGPVMPGLRYVSIPFALAVLGIAVFMVEARIMLGHMTKPTPLHWVHFVAAASLALSSLFIEVIPVSTFAVRFLTPLFAFGWAGAASVGLFAAGLSLESYEDMRPLWAALGGLGAMYLGNIAGPSGTIVFILGVLVFVLSLAFLLAARWDGHLNNWSERLLMAGIIAYFFSAIDPDEAAQVPVLIFLAPDFRSIQLHPVLVPGILIPAFALGGAALLAMATRRVPDKLGRVLVWGGALGIAAPTAISRLLFIDPDVRYESVFVRGLFIAGTVGAVWGFLGLASLLRPPPGDKKRRRNLKAVD